MKIALLPGGFKPPHLGHYNMAKYLADFADDVIVRIGRKERDGIGPELALEIFNYYKAADPDPRAQKLTISVASHPSPVKDVYDFVEQIAPEGSELILGMGEKDAQDGRYNSIPKFAEPRNIKSEIKLVPPQAGGISGTRMREIIKSNNKEEFFKYIPEFLPEEIKEEIWTKLVDTTMPTEVEERITFKPDISLGDVEFLDAQADADMDPIDIDLTSQHFFDRLNDPRNYPNIELGELELFFAKLADKKEEFIKFFNQYKTVVAKDRQTDINIPFMKLANKAIAKTIMRKRNFQTPDPVLPLEEFMGGTMNREEMAKHMANMKKLRKFFSKQSDQMVQVPTKLTKGLRRKLYENIDPEELKKGIEVEKEHTDDPRIAMKIALDHLAEDPKYYTKLATLGLEENLNEGRYDEEVLKQSRFVINKFKEEFGKEFKGESDKSYIGWLKGTPIQKKKSKEFQLNYKLDLEFVPNKDLELMPFDIYANAGPNSIYIKIVYNPDLFPEAYNELTYEVKDAIRHELEHVGQYEFDKDAYPGGENLEGFDYYTAEEEIPAFVQGLYKQAKTRKLPLSQIFDEFLADRSAELTDKEEELIKLIWTDYAIQNLPATQLENYPPYKANQVQQTRYKASDTFTNDRKKAKKLGYVEEMKLFSKDWWSNIITEELLNEGGAAGHMAHPFDLPNVNTGKDLIKIFEQAANSLKKTPGSVKIDGVNASIRLVNFDGKREFAMDRGSKKALDLKGVTKADLEDRFGAGHGMIKAGGDVLDIFNNAMNTIQPELEALGMWDDPNIMFNMEYVSGKSNVQDYGKNFLAIHGLLNVETKEVQGARQMLVKRVTSEKEFNQSDMDSLLKKLEPFAKKKGFEIYGSVPTRFIKEPDFKSVLNKRYTIDTAEGDQTKTLAQWLDGVTNIPKTDRLKMNIEETDSIKDVGALSKQVYFAVFGGENVDSLFNDEQEVNKAIQGATTYLATEKLGDAILDVLDSPMGSVNDHEGVVIRDEKISPRPFKITGKFITGGVSSQFQAK